jgi:hypothetical protein
MNKTNLMRDAVLSNLQKATDMACDLGDLDVSIIPDLADQLVMRDADMAELICCHLQLSLMRSYRNSKS